MTKQTEQEPIIKGVQEEVSVTTQKTKENLGVPLAIVFAGILIAGAILFTASPAPTENSAAAGAQQEEKGDSAPVELLALREGDHVLGNPDAEVLIIEYSDLECPFCKRFHGDMAKLMQEESAKGQVAWVYRHFPLDTLHPKARKEGEALECATELGGNEAFWKYLDKIFEVTPANNGLDLATLPEIGSAMGLDQMQFTECLESGKYADRIQKDYESGVEIGVRGTPYTILWNQKTGKQMAINGAYPYENIKTILNIVRRNSAE